MILNIIALWIVIGLGLWLIKSFIYFRSPFHYLEWVTFMMETAKVNPLTVELIRRNTNSIIFWGFVVYAVMGPFAVIDFISIVVDANRFNKFNKK